jgi:hypothetical protein
LVGPCGRSVQNGATIFSRVRAPIRQLRHAEFRRDIPISHLGPRYTPRSLRRSATAHNIDAQFRELREDCTGNVLAEFRAHASKRSDSPAIRRAPNQAPKPPGLKKRAVNWLKWRHESRLFLSRPRHLQNVSRPSRDIQKPVSRLPRAETPSRGCHH